MWRPEDVAAPQLACSRLSVYRRKREGEGLKKENDMSGNGELFSSPILPLFPQFVFAGFTRTWNSAQLYILTHLSNALF